MNTINSDHIDFKQKFDEKVEELKETLIPLGKDLGTSCAALTFTSILDVLGREELKKQYFNNLATSFSGMAPFISKKGWKGPCGAVYGAIAAIGIVTGGQEKLVSYDVPKLYSKVLMFANKFENKFGSLSCEEICGYNTGTNLKEYVKNRVWEKKCCGFILYAIEKVAKLTRKELKEKWIT